MNKIAIFYHVYQCGDWQTIHTDQIYKLQQSGVYDAADLVHIGGLNPDIILPFYLTKAKYNYSETVVTAELNTLRDLHIFAKENPDYKCLFLHDKGVTWSAPSLQNQILGEDGYPNMTYAEIYENKTAWRNYLEFFVVENWRKCVSLLDEYDCVGTEWHEKAFLTVKELDSSFYSGNFWWANAKYISTLDLDYIENSDFHLYGMNNRHSCELWIGTKNPKSYSFYNSNRNLYLTKIQKSEYMNMIGE